jgi:hypothetical protein
MRAHHREHQQLALEEIGHVDDHIVQVLTVDCLVIGDDHVFGLEAVGPVRLDPILDYRAQISDEVRDTADVKGDGIELCVMFHTMTAPTMTSKMPVPSYRRLREPHLRALNHLGADWRF